MSTGDRGEQVISMRPADVSGMLRTAWRGVQFAFRYEVDQAEHARRTGADIGAVDDPGVLAAVLDLPTKEIGPVVCGAGVHVSDVVASGLADVVLDLDGGVWGHRTGVVPLRPVEAIVPARTLSEGMRRAERLAGYSTRAVLLPARSRPSAALLAECGVYGLGVYQDSDAGVHTLVQTSMMTVQYWSAEWWEFLETMYRGHLAGGEDVDQSSSSSQFWRSAAAAYFGR